jgi:hypothetical protein
MATFEEGYTKFCMKRGVSQELRALLARVYNLIHEASVNLPALRDALVALLSFLCEPENRTSDNCRAVDLFFAVDDHWSVKWDILPENYQCLLDDVGGALHNTVNAPDIAQNFSSTPEQLLDRARKLSL